MAPQQGELKDLTQKVELLEKFQDNCLAILESKGLNPGNKQHMVPFKGISAHAPSCTIYQEFSMGAAGPVSEGVA